MSKIYVQSAPAVLESTASLAISASTSGSAVCNGYAKLVGVFWSNASAAVGAASGLNILQSANLGQNWDLTSASYTVTASAASAISVDVVGNAVKVQFWNGVTAASLFRTAWYLRPI